MTGFCHEVQLGHHYHPCHHHLLDTLRVANHARTAVHDEAEVHTRPKCWSCQHVGMAQRVRHTAAGIRGKLNADKSTARVSTYLTSHFVVLRRLLSRSYVLGIEEGSRFIL